MARERALNNNFGLMSEKEREIVYSSDRGPSQMRSFLNIDHIKGWKFEKKVSKRKINELVSFLVSFINIVVFPDWVLGFLYRHASVIY